MASEWKGLDWFWFWFDLVLGLFEGDKVTPTTLLLGYLVINLNLLIWPWISGFRSFHHKTLEKSKTYTKEGLSRKLRSKEGLCENDVTAWSFQTLAFAMIWNCWKRAQVLKCSDTVCLSSIKTSKRSGTSETCTVWVSLRRLTFHDPGPRWNHQSSTYLSSTLALNFPQYYPIVYISATFSNIHAVYELTEIVLGDTLAFTALHTVRRGRLSLATWAQQMTPGPKNGDIGGFAHPIQLSQLPLFPSR